MLEYFVNKRLETNRETWGGVRKILCTRLLICTHDY